MEESIFALSLQILSCAGLLGKNWVGQPTTNMEKFLHTWAKERKFNIPGCQRYFRKLPISSKNEDFIGAYYQSIRSISSKSKSGSYYTPANLLENIKIPLHRTVLDPCCGSGGILLKILQEKHEPDLIYAWDIDEIALKICLVNLCLFFKNPHITPHIKKHDLIFNEIFANSADAHDTFDYIITNPPWGSKFTQTEKDLLLKRYDDLHTTESFSIALYNAINRLSEHGRLIFFLPYSFLNVATHKGIRKFLKTKQYEMSIHLLGKVFDGVMSEAIRLELTQTHNKQSFLAICHAKAKVYSRLAYDTLREASYLIPATASEIHLDIINKVYSFKHVLLKNNAQFVLGIVTGNNKQHILKEKTIKAEPIYKGKNVQPFRLTRPEAYIEFSPEIYQQVAAVNLYRQPKIVYRFISQKIICTLDIKNRLFLNSANIFIPMLDYPWQTILVLFNSHLYTFMYQKLYHSKKVLRSHMESFPLPLLDHEEHIMIKHLYDKISSESADLGELNQHVYSLFGLTGEEIRIIEKTMLK